MFTVARKASKITLGKKAETWTTNYLKKQGYTIIETNFKSKLGELDIVAQKDGYITFIEVKYRSTLAFGYPYEAVSLTKLERLKKLIDYYYLVRKPQLPARLEIVAIWKEDNKMHLRQITDIIF